jgi:Flp pilus assembly protein TadG
VVRGQNGSTAGTAKTNDVLTFGNIPGAGNNNPSNGDLFAHAGFQALALNTNDSVQFTWQINVTS